MGMLILSCLLITACILVIALAKLYSFLVELKIKNKKNGKNVLFIPYSWYKGGNDM